MDLDCKETIKRAGLKYYAKLTLKSYVFFTVINFLFQPKYISYDVLIHFTYNKMFHYDPLDG